MRGRVEKCQFQAIQQFPTIKYGKVVATQDEAMASLREMVGNNGSGHLMELYGRSAVDDAIAREGKEIKPRNS